MFLLQSLKPLAEIESLRCLSLIGNPVTKLENYRLYVIFTLPQLTLLDFQTVKPKERKEAEKLFAAKISTGEESEEEKDTGEEGMEVEEKDQDAVDGTEESSAAVSGKDIRARRTELLQKIREASTVEEIERLEKELQSLAERM